ncbi:MAG TPA: hypothetical protein VH857_08090 [Actinomycetes bacterium]|nr:hypothetical protein [Actinomycetes bacterium]
MSSNGQVVEHPLLAAAGCAAGALTAAARAAAWQLADDQVQDAIALSLQIEARNAALRATLIAEANTRCLRDRTQSTTTEGWLAGRYRLSTPDARARVEQSDVLARHPRVADALTEGAVTVEQAAVIAQTLDRVADLPLVEPDKREQAAEFLVEQAAALIPRELERAGQQIVAHLTRTPSVDDPAEADAVARERRRAEEEAEAAVRDRACWRHRLRPGRRGRGTLDTGPIGDALVKAWEHRAGKKHPGTDGFQDDRSRDQRLGQALLDLIAADLGQPPLPRPSTGTCNEEPDEADENDETDLTTPLFDQPVEPLFDQRLCDLPQCDGSMCEDDAQAPEASPRRPGPISTRAVLAVTVTLAELRAALAGCAGAGGMLDTGVALTAAELRLLACDAGIIPAVLDSPSQVLDLGRATKEWNMAQRRALAIRDRGCVAPGCDREPFACQAHHRFRWADGGPTDINNGALLCDFHHHQVHRQHWQVILAANGHPALIPPTSIDREQRPIQHHRYRLQLLTTTWRT